MPGNPGRPVYGADEPEPLPQRAFEPIKRAVLNGIARNAAHPVVGLVVIDYLTEDIGRPLSGYLQVQAVFRQSLLKPAASRRPRKDQESARLIKVNDDPRRMLERLRKISHSCPPPLTGYQHGNPCYAPAQPSTVNMTERPERH